MATKQQKKWATETESYREQNWNRSFITSFYVTNFLILKSIRTQDSSQKNFKHERYNFLTIFNPTWINITWMNIKPMTRQQNETRTFNLLTYLHSLIPLLIQWPIAIGQTTTATMQFNNYLLAIVFGRSQKSDFVHISFKMLKKTLQHELTQSPTNHNSWGNKLSTIAKY